ncbi:hypothetical protein GPECTOR_43g934 [Gonium pectorale]|uniref:Uncharacterized protein n=1 Tax=Gonium pectorale TaxID=33097 RepID=A0A150G9H1_GONPE|nr:hypothetical protein GPECTOR_43g934 [Gonium pectorale]|eukprot:KXZ46497.1 hypothetical protein GPECTOR_43g934 [Gonium pectorale]
MSRYNNGTGLQEGALPDFLTLNADTNSLGINQPAPQYELDVGGTVYADRYANVAYADLVGRPTALSSFSNDLSSFPRAITVGGALTAAGYCNLQWAQVGGRPTALSAFSNDLKLSLFSNDLKLSAFSNDLTTFSNLSTPGALQATNAQVNHTVGNIASIGQGVAVYGHLAVQGTAGVNSVFLQNRLVHNQGGSSNLIEVINQQGQIPYSRIVNAPDQPDVNAIVGDIISDLMLAINSDPAALQRLKDLGVFDQFIT